MSKSFMPPVQSEIGYIGKFKDFITDPQTVKYLGRSVVVICISLAAYFVYKNRNKIYSTCHKTMGYMRNKFKKDESTPQVIDSVKTLNIHVHNPVTINIHHVKDDSEEGKEPAVVPPKSKDNSASEQPPL